MWTPNMADKSLCSWKKCQHWHKTTVCSGPMCSAADVLIMLIHLQKGSGHKLLPLPSWPLSFCGRKYQLRMQMDSTTGAVILCSGDAESLQSSKEKKAFAFWTAGSSPKPQPAALQALRAFILLHKPSQTSSSFPPDTRKVPQNLTNTAKMLVISSLLSCKTTEYPSVSVPVSSFSLNNPSLPSNYL